MSADLGASSTLSRHCPTTTPYRKRTSCKTVTQIQGFGDTAQDYDITVENPKAGAGVRALLAIGRCPESTWGRSKPRSPEAYVTLQIPLGQESKCSAIYQFYYSVSLKHIHIGMFSATLMVGCAT